MLSRKKVFFAIALLAALGAGVWWSLQRRSVQSPEPLRQARDSRPEKAAQPKQTDTHTIATEASARTSPEMTPNPKSATTVPLREAAANIQAVTDMKPSFSPVPISTAEAASAPAAVPQSSGPVGDERLGTARMVAAHAPLRTAEVANPDSVANRQILETMVAKALAQAKQASTAPTPK